MNIFRKFKKYVYYHLVEKNEKLCDDYESYVNANKEFHRNNRLASWKYMIALRSYYKSPQKKQKPSPPALVEIKHVPPSPSQPSPAPKRNSSPNTQKPNSAAAPKPAPPTPQKNATSLSTKSSLSFPESQWKKRISPEQLTEQLLSYDVISFDVFETLIFRKFNIPKELFHLVGNLLHIANFQQIRIQAELEEKRETMNPNEQYTIQDIYKRLSKFCGIDVEQGVQTEIDTEIAFCYANPYMKQVFDSLIEAGKCVIAVSDMYLPYEYVNQLLENCGYTGFHDIFVSCDYLCSKRDGQLQKIAHKKLGTHKKVIHIGDNSIGDVQGSKKAGWEAIHYPSCAYFGSDYRPSNMSLLTGSLYSGIVNNTLHNGLFSNIRYYEHGFVYGGILTAGFCKWINEIAPQQKVDKLLFVARDADIFYKAYNKHYRQLDNEYVFMSRFSLQQLVFQDFTEEYIQYNIKKRYPPISDCRPIGEILEEVGLACLIECLEDFNLTEDEKLTSLNYEVLRKCIYQNKAKICDHFSDSLEAAYQYFKPIVEGCKTVCLVDVGWNGSAVAHLNHLFNNVFNFNIKVIGANVFCNDSSYANSLITNQMLFSYIYSAYQNADMLSCSPEPKLDNIRLLFTEAMFSSKQPSLIRYGLRENNKDVLEFTYGSENKNSPYIAHFQKGILDFVDLFEEAIVGYEDYFKIYPIDAYAPLFHINTNIPYNFGLFGHFEENKYTMSGFLKPNRKTTLKEIMKLRKIV